MDNRLDVGREGEALAASYLEAAGYAIVARNVRTKLGEIDLIARDGHVLVFVEVKSRRSERFGRGVDAVDARKQARLRRLAEAYLGTRSGSEAVRFDVVDVLFKYGTTPDLVHVRAAF